MDKEGFAAYRAPGRDMDIARDIASHDLSEEPEISQLRRIRCGGGWRDMPVPAKVSRRRRGAGDITTPAESLEITSVGSTKVDVDL